MGKNEKRIVLIVIMGLIVTLSVVTYAYYIGSTNNDKAQTASVSTGTMNLVFADNDNGFGGAIEFGQTITKKFTIQNTGTLDASAVIEWKNLVNTYLPGSLVYNLEYSETANGTYTFLVNELYVPNSETAITRILAPKVTVPVGKTYYYNLNITLVDSETVDQTTDLDANFFTQFSIKPIDVQSSSLDTLAHLKLSYNNGEIDSSKFYSPFPVYVDDNFSKTNIRCRGIKNYLTSKPYIVYADSYTFDKINHEYTLVNPQIGKYIDIYDRLEGKYIVDETSSAADDTVLEGEDAIYYYSATSVYRVQSGSTDTKICTLPGSYSTLYNEQDIYSQEDDYGTSYYFRGNVTNNYVNFAGFFWRIIRINGDGSLRLLYDGTVAHVNGEETQDNVIGPSPFNSLGDKNAYVGYMYGNPDAETYAETHANTNSSTIKTFIEEWYVENIENKGFASYVSDEIFCNDRSVTAGTGVGTTNTTYGYVNRINQKTETLKCPQKNDAFTVNDTVKGNGALSKPIGLLTADEAILIGMKRQILNIFNCNGYYCKNYHYWLMSPREFTTSVINNYGSNWGYVGTQSNIATNNMYVVPVINLSKGTAVSLIGTGTMTDPYRLS